MLESFLRGFYRSVKEHAGREVKRKPEQLQTALESRAAADQILLTEVGEKALIRTPKAVRLATKHVEGLPRNVTVTYSAGWSHNIISGFSHDKLGNRRARFTKIIASEDSEKVKEQLDPLGIKASELEISQIEVLKNGTTSHLKHLKETFGKDVVVFKSHHQNVYEGSGGVTSGDM